MKSYITESQKHIPVKPTDLSKYLRRILELNPNLTKEELATKINKSVDWINKTLKLTDPKNQ